MISRPYESDKRDLSQLLAFITEANQVTAPEPWEFHRGDLLWQRFIHDDAESQWFERVRIWLSDDGEILGFAIYNIDANECTPLLTPSQWDNIPLIESIIDWARDCEQTLRASQTDSTGLCVSITAGTLLAATLNELGWQSSDDEPLLRFVRSLDSLPQPILPAGFEVRPLAGPEEYQPRVDAHREAFHPSKFTLESYEIIRHVDGYDPELDLVTVSPDGQFASYCIVWYDPVTREGLFEPVGARKLFRGKGLTKAALYSAMHRIKAMGGKRVLVLCESGSDAACALYRSVGFEEKSRIVFLRQP